MVILLSGLSSLPPSSMPRFFPGLIPVLLSLAGQVSEAVPAEQPALAIRFTQSGISFSGRIQSEETGQELARVARKVRPDLPIRNEGLRIDSSATSPPMAHLKSLLSEIGLSSHEGGVAFYPDRVVLTGMTDSLVTVTAIQLRLEPILGNRQLVNRICIVSSADLPDSSIRLSSGETSQGLLDFDFYPSREEAFVAPGVPLEKLRETLVLMSSFERFVDPEVLRQSATMRATPLTMGNTARADPETAEGEGLVLRAVPSVPVTRYVELEPLLFSRNSFLLQAGTQEVIARNAETLATPDLAGKKVLVRALKWNGASPDFIAYLAGKRADEAKKHLNRTGIPDSRLEIEIVSSPSPVDTGEVRIVVEFPPGKQENGGEKQDPAVPDLFRGDDEAGEPADPNPAAP